MLKDANMIFTVVFFSVLPPPIQNITDKIAIVVFTRYKYFYVLFRLRFITLSLRVFFTIR